ncbi:GtrA family protein [Desulfobulbus alkaliphilus]|uniref:GtrA family protein n=1 Tax=Desulfobulbus alkaliphilus TaxID=869814 RepID=UPI0019650513|nr:GtrA family protein [Desulfobulbus alkaliphilus]MBM9537995.1 GtrA family protein [Desulfobulbus alkaliphilus]
MQYKKLCIGILQRKKYLKFLISGSLAAMTNLGALFVFHGLIHLPIVPAASLAFIMAYLVSFSLQKFWTFADSDRERIAGQMLIYFLVGVFGLILNAVGMYLLVEVFLVWYLLAQIIMSAGLAVMNFFIYRWIFRSRKAAIREDNRYRKILLAGNRPDKANLAMYAQFLGEEIGLSPTDVEIRSVVYSEIDKKKGAEKMSGIRRELDAVRRSILFFREVWRQASWAEVICVCGAAVSQGLIAYLACRLRCKKYLLSIMDEHGFDKRRRSEDAISDPGGLLRSIYQRLQRRLWAVMAIFVAHGASRIFVPSEHLRRVVVGWGIEEQIIRILPEAAELAHPIDENLDP